jgi:hypothetical protein
MKSNINSVEVHPQQLRNNGHPVDGALVGAGSLWPSDPTLKYIENFLSFKPLCVGILSNT